MTIAVDLGRKATKQTSDGSLSQYVTFDVKHICKVSFKYST